MRKTGWWKEGLKLADKMQKENMVLFFHNNYENEDFFVLVNDKECYELKLKGNKNDMLRRYDYYFRRFLRVDYRAKDTLILVVDDDKLEKYKKLYK
jgi:hypothetical protein